MSRAPVDSPSEEGWSRRHKVSCAGRLGKGETSEPVPFRPLRWSGINGVETKRKLDLTAGMKNSWRLQGKLADGTVVEFEARASLFTDPISDVRQMHMNVVKCSN
ncbi:hypothetical protein TNCV_4685891 [Trichonephila clavipes]|nr:hypothetical protein TNCV_4685891 [Trichonephila clavipes]